MIDPEYICQYWNKMSETVLSEKATFFDTTTALAFSYFRDKKVDAAVIETGLGGRLDSTNIVRPEVVILTPIHRDHTRQLGSKLSDIAREKADIIKNGCTVFCAVQHRRVGETLTEYRDRSSAWFDLNDAVRIRILRHHRSKSLFCMEDVIRGEKYEDLELNLEGDHQVANASLAYLTGRWFLEKRGIRFEPALFRKALKKIYWPGRFHQISSSPDIILDVSHNYDGFRKTIALIENRYHGRKVHLLIGLLSDKEYRLIAKLVYKRFSSVTVTNPVHERVLPPEKFQSYIKSLGGNARVIQNYREAWHELTGNLAETDVLIIMGSHFLIGAIWTLNQEKLDFIS
jgi:dihydrofolate synthase/folylpolyglutamate synthase